MNTLALSLAIIGWLLISRIWIRTVREYRNSPKHEPFWRFVERLDI